MDAAELVAAMRAGIPAEEIEELTEYLVDQLTDAAVILENTLERVLKAVDEDERELL